MRGRPADPSTDPRRRWRLAVGLAIALLTVGHDALMAGNVETSPLPDARPGVASADVPPPNPSQAAPSHRRPHHVGLHPAPPAAGGLDEGTTVPHPASCGTARSAVPRLGGDSGGDGPCVGGVVALLRSFSSPPADPPCWPTSTQPPRTRRALLQVYRI